MKHFKYTNSELIKRQRLNSLEESSFDSLLLSEWWNAMNNGLFRFKLQENQLPSRYLPGRYNFFLQLNPSRFSQKRPTEVKPSRHLRLPFDSSRFNFTRINKEEILLKLIKTDDKQQTQRDDNFKASSADSDQELEGDFIIINNSPIEIGHVLIVPRLNSNQNQVINVEAIELATDLALLTGSKNLVFGFNSIGAFSSVNHLHVQGYYLNCNSSFHSSEPLAIHRVKNANALAQCLWYLDDVELFFFPTFMLQLCDFNNDTNAFASKVHSVTDYLTGRNIPHNLVIIKCDKLICESRSTGETTIRVAIWPKKHTIDIEPNKWNLYFAMCELAGHLILDDEKNFNEVTEGDALEALSTCKLDNEQYLDIQNDLIKLFST